MPRTCRSTLETSQMERLPLMEEEANMKDMSVTSERLGASVAL